jgi:hypothetical protein
MASSARTGGDPLPLVAKLVEIGSADTVYRDVYLDRARSVMGGLLTAEDFRRVEQDRADLAELPLAIARAMDAGNWPHVKELSGRAQVLRQAVESRRHVMEAAREVYAVTDVKLDPFSPGLQPFTKIPAQSLAGLRSRAIEQLAALERGDPPWKEFYAGRRAAFQALAPDVAGRPAAEGAAAPVGDVREEAARALKAGNMGALEKLAEAMMRAAKGRPDRSAAFPPSAPSAPAPAPPSVDLLVSYSADTLAAAPRLGLAARRLESRADVASLRQYAWDPLFADEAGRIESKHVSLPAGTPEAFRERLEMLMIHPLVSSGGARHLPTLVAEDVLVEDFPDPGEGEKPAPSELLAVLGLGSRRGLSRIAIERALLDHGARLLEKELGLDPRAFRLVCIPPDVHLRLGEAEGWGRQPLWTHFDGYLVMADGRLRALVGGDVRFGGLYDLLSHSRDYESDRVIARFAVVRRERMVAW